MSKNEVLYHEISFTHKSLSFNDITFIDDSRTVFLHCVGIARRIVESAEDQLAIRSNCLRLE